MRRIAASVLLSLLLTSGTYAQTASLGLNAPQLYEKGMNNLMGAGVSRNDVNAVESQRHGQLVASCAAISLLEVN
jgi:hypothetical protein